ncbi:5-oxoproline transporter, DUF979 family subunit [Enterococcus sp. HY326]
MKPIVANFNIIPVSIFGMKARYGVIKNQVAMALFMLVF